MRALLFTLLSFLASPAMAHDEHGVGHLTGPNLDLVYADHAIAGAVAGLPLYASPLVDEFGIKLTHRAGGADFEAVLRDTDGVLGGDASSISVDGVTTTSSLKFTRISAADGTIAGTLNGKDFLVTITSDTMDGNHYVDPKFHVTIGDKVYDFALEGGAACIGCATKISFVILTMLQLANLP